MRKWRLLCPTAVHSACTTYCALCLYTHVTCPSERVMSLPLTQVSPCPVSRRPNLRFSSYFPAYSRPSSSALTHIHYTLIGWAHLLSLTTRQPQSLHHHPRYLLLLLQTRRARSSSTTRGDCLRGGGRAVQPVGGVVLAVLLLARVHPARV